ncbi:MAG: peptide chain release factor H [Oscillatoria sp. SIO1A7]|nr:peptide chain release factor H [Oscillatoria sp. SIO1A7]
MNNYLQITSGRGPEECCWVVARLLDILTREATEAGIKVRLLEAIPSETPETLKSALLALEGEKSELENFLAGWTGTVQWIGSSPFRPKHKRKNWFVGVESLAAPEQIEKIERSQKDLEWQTVRGSGPGGQHRNKTETAVRVVHKPTGLSAIAQEERSQSLNRKLALARLLQRLQQRQTEKENANRQQRWDLHNNLERGNPTRIYIGQKFDLK